MGGMGLTSEGVAIIHVSDINNNAPQFSPASVSLRQQYEGYFVWFKTLMTIIIITALNLLICVLCMVRAVQHDSSGEQEGLWDWSCECDRQRRPRNRKLGSQILHFQRPQRQLCHQYGSCHQPGCSDGGEGTNCWAAFNWNTPKKGIVVTVEYPSHIVAGC